MKKILTILMLAVLWAMSASAHLLEDLWNRYAPKSASVQSVRGQTPGRVMGRSPGKDTSSFTYHWKYRWRTYELHFEDSAKLARSVYGLALHAGDVSPRLPREKFYGGVLGFHYSVNQVCAWLNDAAAKRLTLSEEENRLVGMLLQDGIIAIEKGGWGRTGKVSHILAAAPGKKRSFAENLRHERLHVFWDEDSAFRARERAAWKQMPEGERARVRRELKNYAQDNEPQLVEEWAVKRAEASNMPLE